MQASGLVLERGKKIFLSYTAGVVCNMVDAFNSPMTLMRSESATRCTGLLGENKYMTREPREALDKRVLDQRS